MTRPFSRRRFVKTGLIFVPALVLPHDMVRTASLLPQPTLNDDTYRWAYSRVPTAGSSVSAASIMKNDALITGLRQHGLRSKIYRLGSFAGNTLAALSAPLIVDTRFSAASTDTLTGYVAGDYSESTGLAGRAASYIDTTFDPHLWSNLIPNDWHISLYCRTGSDAGTVTAGCQSTGSWVTGIYISLSGTTYFDAWLADAGGRCSFADSLGVGFYLGTKVSSSSLVLYKNAVSKATAGGSAATPTGGISVTMAINAQRDSTTGFGSINTTRTQSAYSLGSGMSASDSSAFYTVMQAYQASYARQV